MHLLRCFSSVVIFLSFYVGLNAQLHAQSFVGTASGYVIAPQGTQTSEVLGGQGQWQQQVLVDAGILNEVQANPASGEVRAATLPGVNRAASTGNTNELHYAGSYWADELTFTGGTGSFWTRFETELTGSISDANGKFEFGDVDALTGPNSGEVAVRYREFIGNRDLPPGNPSTDPNYFLDLFEDHYSAFDESPFQYDFIDSFGFIIGVDENGYPEEATGALNTGNRDDLLYVSNNRSILWEYDTPLPISYLLETWAVDGGVADFSNTGQLMSIEVPAGVQVTSASGTVYNVISVPEPVTNMLWLMALLVGIARRRKD